MNSIKLVKKFCLKDTQRKPEKLKSISHSIFQSNVMVCLIKMLMSGLFPGMETDMLSYEFLLYTFCVLRLRPFLPKKKNRTRV